MDDKQLSNSYATARLGEPPTNLQQINKFFSDDKQITNLKEINGKVVVNNPSIPTIHPEHSMDFKPTENCEPLKPLKPLKPLRNIKKSNISIESKINVEMQTHVDVLINDIQYKTPNYMDFGNIMGNISNNIVETAKLAMQMGDNSIKWNRIIQVGNSLTTFSHNIKSMGSIDTTFSIEMCSNYWGMAVNAMSILSTILNDDDQPNESFSYIFDSLNKIYDALKKGFERLESILIDCVCERLTDIYDQLVRMETIMCDSFRDIHRKDLINIADAIKKDLSGEFVQTNSERRDLLLKLSTWIDCHCTSSIEVAKNRICLESPLLLNMLNNANPSFIINLTMTLLNEPETIPNVDICLSACKLFSIAHKKWKIDYNAKLLYGRVSEMIQDTNALIESFDEYDVDTLIRQMNHYRFMIGRSIARVGFEIQNIPMIDQINKMTNKDEIMKLVDSIELRRLVIIKMCEMRDIKITHKLISKEEYLRTIPNIQPTTNRTPYRYLAGCMTINCRSTPTGGHLIAEKGQTSELLKYLEYGMNVNAHCGWGNVLLNYLLGTPNSENTREPLGLHNLLKCSELDTTSGQTCKTDPNSTWPIGSRPIQYILNCCSYKLAILFVANGYDIDLTNYGMYNGSNWGDCANLYQWASNGDKNAIITLEVIKMMEDKNSFMYKDKLRSAYKYYKEYESGLKHTSQKTTRNDYMGNPKSLCIFSCLLGLIPPAIQYHMKYVKSLITPHLKWDELAGTENWKKITTPIYETVSTRQIDSNYAKYLKAYDTKLNEMIETKTESNESINKYKKWSSLLEDICNSINKPHITDQFQLFKDSVESEEIKQNLNLLNAMLKQEPQYNIGTNIDILLNSDL